MWTVAFRRGLYEEVRSALSVPRAACVPLLARPHRKTPRSGVIMAHGATGPGRLVTASDASGPLGARAGLIRGLLGEAAGSGSIPLLAFGRRGVAGRLLAGRGDYEMLDVFDEVFGYRPRGGPVPEDIDVGPKMYREIVAPRHRDRSPDVPRGAVAYVVLDGYGMGNLADADDDQRITGVEVIGDTVSELRSGLGVLLAAAGAPGCLAEAAAELPEGGGLHPAGLGSRSVAVVGAGEMGRRVAAQLAQMRPARMLLVDRGVVRRADTSRERKAAGSGRPKAEVLAELIRPGSGVRVDAEFGDVADDRIRRRIAGTDAIMGCADAHACRDALNDIAVRHYIPLVDARCSGPGGPGGRGPEASVQVVTADTACLLCTGSVDEEAAGKEAAKPAKRPRARKRGPPARPDDGAAPPHAVAVAASVAVSKLMCALGAAGPGYNTRVAVDVHGDRMDGDRPAIRDGCACAGARGSPSWDFLAPLPRRSARGGAGGRR